MPWTLFWTCLAQVVIAAFLLSVPVSFFIFMVGAQVKRTYGRPTAPSSVRYAKP